MAADENRFDPREPVMTNGPEGADARACPIRYMMWHEIVNNAVEGYLTGLLAEITQFE